MTDFSIFEDHHLIAAEALYASDFAKCAAQGLLSTAECSHTALLAVRAELERRAIANIQSGKAA